MIDMFRRSAGELKHIQCLAVTGILSAVYIVLNAYAVLPLLDTQVTFGYIALAIIGMLYGPVVAVLAAIPCDIFAAILRPDVAPNFLFTPNRMLEGLIYGLLLYGFARRGNSAGDGGGKKVKWAFRQIARVCAARLLVMVICYVVINSLLIYLIYAPPSAAGKTFFAWMIARSGIKNVIQYPVDLALMFTLLPAVRVIYNKSRRFGGRSAEENSANVEAEA